MTTRTAAALAGLLLLGMALPTRVNAAPTCTTISVVMLPGYQCQLGGLVFSDLVGGGGARIFGTGSISGPSSYDLVFNWVGNQVILSYQPVGGSLMTAMAQS